MTEYEAGDTVFEDEPYAAIVSATSLDSVCSFCFKNYVEYRCSLCNRLSYCTEGCQQADVFHDRVECIALADQDKIVEDEVRLVIRTAARYKHEQQRNYASLGNFFGLERGLDDLVSHLEDLNDDERQKVKAKAQQIKSILDRVGVSIERKELMEIYMKCKINCHLVIDHNEPEYLSRGRAIYLAASKLDHTCVPTENYTLMFDGRRLVIRAMKNFTLKDPSDLRIHYVPSNLSYNDRRDRLLKNYFFLCSCDQCVSQLRFPAADDDSREERVSEIAEVLRQYDPDSWSWFDTATKVLQKFEGVTDRDFHLHWLLLHTQQAAAHQKLYSRSLEYGTRALKGATTVMGFQRILFGLLSCAKHLGWNKRDSAYIDNFTGIKRISEKLFTITHGKDHSIVKMISESRPVEQSR
ncbi:histone-lysine N-methyltransferase Smyd1-like [Galendromus occidentalis]|uniref:Histone-lysine N-methyltransferase Smyd1-like n=1 Tax=Galendromus occidentalis TaxID=34638 RepID=A0AAJ6QTK8_9ACAR|nr:histone-lysine N-methyltransferase Smyd1-like [Galendromus occidentalis]